MVVNPNPTNHDGAGQPAAPAIQMSHQTNPCPIDATPGAEAFDDKFLSMTEGEFEDFLAIAVEGYADAMETPASDIRTFRQAGVMTASKGLVVRIGDAEFQVAIVRRR